jgi:predicted MFS family arabinose efflux permease
MKKTKSIKKLSIALKIILTLTFMLGSFNLWTYFDPVSAFNTFESWESLNLFNRLVGFVYAVSVVILNTQKRNR